MPFPSRRAVLAGGVALALPARAAASVRITLLGQSLIQQDLRAQAWSPFADFAARFRRSDACFTNLETTIAGPHAGAATRDPALALRADPAVLDCLSAMGVNLLSTANNHAFDVGTGGVIDTLAALKKAGAVYAGTGMDIAAASAPATLHTPAGPVALVAMATGKIRDGGMATPDRPGVNEVRQDAPGVLNESDVARFLDAIAEAHKAGAWVIAYNHNHYWEPVMTDTPAWQKALARRAIDAGACAFVSHGAPQLQGIELYRKRPIFYDLGNFLFQSPHKEDPYGPETWRSVMAECVFTADGLKSAVLTPIVLNPSGTGGPDDFATKGRPAIAAGADADPVLDHVEALCAPLGTRVTRQGGTGTIG